MLHSAYCALIQIEAINYFCLFGIKIDKSLLFKWHITRDGKSIEKMDDFSIDSLSSGVLCTILIALWILKCILNWKFNHTVNYVIYFKNKTAVVFLPFHQHNLVEIEFFCLKSIHHCRAIAIHSIEQRLDFVILNVYGMCACTLGIKELNRRIYERRVTRGRGIWNSSNWIQSTVICTNWQK